MLQKDSDQNVRDDIKQSLLGKRKPELSHEPYCKINEVVPKLSSCLSRGTAQPSLQALSSTVGEHIYLKSWLRTFGGDGGGGSRRRISSHTSTVQFTSCCVVAFTLSTVVLGIFAICTV